MRRNIVHVGAGTLSYEIREIVGVGHEIQALGQNITWENIGDPTQKGERVPDWMREIIRDLVDDERSWGYCDTAGVSTTREFLAAHVNARGGVQVTTDDILFFNGLGDAVARVYGYLRREARILGPSPAYSTHSSAEAAHSGYSHLTYELDPYDGWLPDLEDIRNKVRYNDAIAGILLLSPDNPTGAVYPRAVLEEIAEIARQYDLFMIADEIYVHMVYNGNPRMHMSEWIGDVPAFAMRGISKEYPWPGSRCGWIEILNKDTDENFATYAKSILDAKRLEVCSTTLPQMSIPPIMGDPRYQDHLEHREQLFEGRAAEAFDAFKTCDAVVVNKPSGAFYFTVMFKHGVLNDQQTLPIESRKVRERVEQLVMGVPPDKRFVYYLMGATGIVVVPLTGFQCSHEGFRITLLETDDAKRAWIFKSLREAIDHYVAS
jgi:aspartate/methionine/tyrosine aminotransferase